MENFDGVGDDPATPMASPVKRYDGSSSPYRAKTQEQEEDSARPGVSLAEHRDKPTNRGSPKKAPVGSRSRSPRRQATRSDKGDSDREEDASDREGRARTRSAASSPRSRNRRGRGGKGDEDNGDESDAARAPRSDRDNSISGGDTEGSRWQSSVSVRSPLAGGTRAHKSPLASPSSRLEAIRGREASPKASRNGYDYDYDDDGDGDGEDREEDNGVSPRNRKAGRKGDWEQQASRSNAMQSQPRRRRPDGHNQSRSRRRGKRDDDEEEDEG